MKPEVFAAARIIGSARTAEAAWRPSGTPARARRGTGPRSPAGLAEMGVLIGAQVEDRHRPQQRDGVTGAPKLFASTMAALSDVVSTAFTCARTSAMATSSSATTPSAGS